jgi:tetratricopeptide (TPR) repeat protein
MRALKRQVDLGNLHKVFKDAISAPGDFPLRNSQLQAVAAMHALAATVLMVLTGSFASSLLADDRKEPYSPSKTVIVTDRAAPIMASEKTLASVPAGTILAYTKEEGNWLLIPRYGGWLKRDNSLPIELGEEHFTKLIKEQPNWAAYHHRGNVRLMHGQFAEAAADFSEAARLEPTFSSPLVNRGIAKTGLGDLAGARRDFDRALELNPKDATALVHRAMLSLDENNLASARTDVEALLEVQPASAEGFDCRGLIHLRENKLDEALADFSKAIEIFPQFSGAYLNRGTAHVARREYEAALKDYASAQQYDPNNVRAFNDAAWLLATCPVESVRNPKLAVQLAEQADSLSDVPVGNFLDTLAAAYAADGRFDDAVQAAEHALKVMPDDEKPGTAARLEKYRQKKMHVEDSPATAPVTPAP